MIVVEDFGDRQIAIKGVGRLFYESGFPISLSISELKKKDIEVSILHVADECLKHGWSVKTTINKLIGEIEDDIDNNIIDKQTVVNFCCSTYEEQREMIFNYLFKDKEMAKKWFIDKIISSVN